jgi:hypothetical protein
LKTLGEEEGNVDLLLDVYPREVENCLLGPYSIEEDMASTPKQSGDLHLQLAEIKGSLKVLSAIAAILATVAIGFGWYTVRLGERISHLEGKIGDPLGAALKGLESPASNSVLAANLDLLSAQIKIVSAKQTKPKPDNIQKIAKVLATVTRQHPDFPETWQAVALLASYRASDILGKSVSVPDCDTSQKPHLIDLGDVPELHKMSSELGYLFRNCRLHLDHLPAGKLRRGTIGPNDSGTRQEIPVGTEFRIGVLAFIVNCEIVLNDSGISESDILFFEAVNCRLAYRVERVPKPSAQNLLLASLEAPIAGQFSVKLT